MLATLLPMFNILKKSGALLVVTCLACGLGSADESDWLDSGSQGNNTSNAVLSNTKQYVLELKKVIVTLGHKRRQVRSGHM